MSDRELTEQQQQDICDKIVDYLQLCNQKSDRLDEPHGYEQIGRCSNTPFDAVWEVLDSYVVPSDLWGRIPTRERRQNYVAPRIPPNVSLDCWKAFRTPRLAYVRTWNWEKKGVRGLFSLTHQGTSRFGLRFFIGHAISPTLYTYLNSGMGESVTNFAIREQDVWWLSAVIGAFEDYPGDEKGGRFWVHYSDDGEHYRMLQLPYAAFANYMQLIVPKELRAASWHGESVSEQEKRMLAPGSVQGDDRPLVTGQGGLHPIVMQPPASLVTGPQTAAGGTAEQEAAPLLNETFYGVDMDRFWKQFMTSLDILLWSPVGSASLLAQLQTKAHFSAISAYMQENRGTYAWVPPQYAASMRGGNLTKPDYLSK